MPSSAKKLRNPFKSPRWSLSLGRSTRSQPAPAIRKSLSTPLRLDAPESHEIIHISAPLTLPPVQTDASLFEVQQAYDSMRNLLADTSIESIPSPPATRSQHLGVHRNSFGPSLSSAKTPTLTYTRTGSFSTVTGSSGFQTPKPHRTDSSKTAVPRSITNKPETPDSASQAAIALLKSQDAKNADLLYLELHHSKSLVEEQREAIAQFRTMVVKLLEESQALTIDLSHSNRRIQTLEEEKRRTHNAERDVWRDRALSSEQKAAELAGKLAKLEGELSQAYSTISKLEDRLVSNSEERLFTSKDSNDSLAGFPAHAPNDTPLLNFTLPRTRHSLCSFYSSTEGHGQLSPLALRHTRFRSVSAASDFVVEHLPERLRRSSSLESNPLQEHDTDKILETMLEE